MRMHDLSDVYDKNTTFLLTFEFKSQSENAGVRSSNFSFSDNA